MIHAHLYIVHVLSFVCSAEPELSTPVTIMVVVGKRQKKTFNSLRPIRVIIVLNNLKYPKI